MKNKILTAFPVHAKYEEKSTEEIYVVDYTERTKNTEQPRSVEIHSVKPDDIDGLYLDNSNILSVSSIVFGEQCVVCNEGRELKHCECVLFPKENDNTTWVLFVEIKDCKFKNISTYFQETKNQILNTVNEFRNRGIISASKRVSGIISFPRVNKLNFHTQLVKQAERQHFINEYGIILKGTNQAIIKNTVSIL